MAAGRAVRAVPRLPGRADLVRRGDGLGAGRLPGAGLGGAVAVSTAVVAVGMWFGWRAAGAPAARSVRRAARFLAVPGLARAEDAGRGAGGTPAGPGDGAGGRHGTGARAAGGDRAAARALLHAALLYAPAMLVVAAWACRASTVALDAVWPWARRSPWPHSACRTGSPGDAIPDDLAALPGEHRGRRPDGVRRGAATELVSRPLHAGLGCGVSGWSRPASRSARVARRFRRWSLRPC